MAAVVFLLLYLQWVMVIGDEELVSEFPRNSFGDTFSNMAAYNGIIYIGAKNYIFVLNATDLSEVHRIRTCKGECSNINKVLVVNKMLNQLITCGTGNDGSCNIRALNTTVSVLGTSFTLDKDMRGYLVVSTDEKRPSAFVLTEDGLYAGVTYGSGVTTVENNYYSYLSYYSLIGNSFVNWNSLQVELADVHLESYLIYFKAGFELGGFVYFVTNQKFKVGDGSYISKLIRICQNDTNFYSYTDIKLECVKNGIVYSMIQDVSVFEPGEDLKRHFNASGKIMAATFSSGSDPESPQSPSAVCLYRLEDIDSNILQAKRNFITCPDRRLSEQERYLHSNMRACINNTLYREDIITCNRNLPKFSYITGDINASLSAHATFITGSGDYSGYLSKVKTSTTGKYTVLHTGTSRGQLIKSNINTAQAYVFEARYLDKGHPITGIHVEPGGRIEYVMSERKIMRYGITNCTYSTCAATMEAKNPQCGWCVYENKSTFKENSTCQFQSYQGHWLSSLTECLILVVDPKGVPVETQVRVSVSVSIPQQVDNDTYECSFSSSSGIGNSAATLDTDGNHFQCITTRPTVHSEGKLEFYVIHSGKRIFIAETDFLFFDCGNYNKCGDCTGDSRAKCSWDSLNARCLPEDVTSSWFIQENTSCPMFQSDTDKHYLPSDVAKKLIINVSNLPNSSAIRYQCKLKDSIVAAVKENENQISSTLQALDGRCLCPLLISPIAQALSLLV